MLWGVLLVASVLSGFLLLKHKVTFNSSMSKVNRDYDTVLENVDLEGIHVNSDNDVINILVIGNDYRKETNYNASGLTDTMIIATVDMKHNVLKTTSFDARSVC